MPNLKLAALAAVLAAVGLAGVTHYATSAGAPPPVAYADASAVTALAARLHSAEQIQKAQAGSIGGLQADVQTLQRALDALTAPPAKAKAKGKQIETGSVKLK